MQTRRAGAGPICETGLVRSRIPGYQAVALRPPRRDRPLGDEQQASILVSRIGARPTARTVRSAGP